MPTRIFLFGLCGKMGKALYECAPAQDCEIVGGYDRKTHESLPTFCDLRAVNVPFDVIADFSRPETLPEVISLATKTKRPVVLATTGYNEKQQRQIDELAQSVPVFQSGNYSIGIYVLTKLAAAATRALGRTFDVEIVEKHHTQKADAPSGTAKLLAAAVGEALPSAPRFVYGREGTDVGRKPYDVGIHAVRGGTLAGEHEVLLCGEDEVLTLSHSAGSRKIFAVGALKAARFLQSRPVGAYDMNDLIGNLF